jgi:hypothetical protein
VAPASFFIGLAESSRLDVVPRWCEVFARAQNIRERGGGCEI